MKWLDLTFPTPAENLACDEALLDLCDEGCEHEILRCWEPAQYFVVAGYANRLAAEINAAACNSENIVALRRSSGGGTVLQGPGCLNYALILNVDAAPALAGIVSTNRYVMERNRAALEALIISTRRAQTPRSSASIPQAALPRIEVRGHTDLVLDGRKFSGNAQRRKKRFLLFHGTVLLQFNLPLIEKVLPLPSRQPAYRRNRSHQDFLINLDLPAASVKYALQNAWNAREPQDNVPHEKIASLVRDKYATAGWNLKF